MGSESKALITGGADHSIRFWDLETGFATRTLVRPLKEILVPVDLRILTVPAFSRRRLTLCRPRTELLLR